MLYKHPGGSGSGRCRSSCPSESGVYHPALAARRRHELRPAAGAHAGGASLPVPQRLGKAATPNYFEDFAECGNQLLKQALQVRVLPEGTPVKTGMSISKAVRTPRAERQNASAGQRATDLLRFRRERPCRNRIVLPNRIPSSFAQTPGAPGEFHHNGQVRPAARAFAGASEARQTNWTHQAPWTKKRSSPRDFTASLSAL
jgi:hypothetical protein